ncbi:hypothetical protein ACIRVF_03960 [Kitasatospora sp. NPDC101157]|uniref:hypothetical protein n=1 Tax=Kitasatospora sp. NPDC101157 TaxID=3364098 RepID=UPI00380B3826
MPVPPRLARHLVVGQAAALALAVAGAAALDWAAGLLQGDLGASASGRPVGAMLGDRVGNSALPAGPTMLLLVPVSLGLGLLAAVHHGRTTDRVITTASLLLVSVFEFVVAGGRARPPLPPHGSTDGAVEILPLMRGVRSPAPGGGSAGDRGR